MALGADDVQAAEFDDFIVILLPLFAELAVDLIPFGALGRSDGAGLHVIRIFRLLAEEFFGEKFRVAAEQNIRSASGHVGGDGDGSFVSGLGDDERFAFVIFGIQDFVADAHALEES